MTETYFNAVCKTASDGNGRRRLVLGGVLAFIFAAAIIVIPVCVVTLRSKNVPVIETKAEESLPSLIKVAPIGATSGAILIEYTELLEDETTVFYYLTVQDLNFTTFDGVTDADNLVLYLTRSAEPRAQDIVTNDLFARLLDPIRIGLVSTVDFPFRLPEFFLPGDFNGVLLIEENSVEEQTINQDLKIISSASFAAIVDPERNIGSSSTNNVVSQPTQSPSKSERPNLRTPVPTSKPPTLAPSRDPTGLPALVPSKNPTEFPTPVPSSDPTSSPSVHPITRSPTEFPTKAPLPAPTSRPTVSPSARPTITPTISPSARPTVVPSPNPTRIPTISPQPTETGFTPFPTNAPSFDPTNLPTLPPTRNPTSVPSSSPTKIPTTTPTPRPTPTPTDSPTGLPSTVPTTTLTTLPTNRPSTSPPTIAPSPSPTKLPTAVPTFLPTVAPTVSPTKALDPASSQLPPVLTSELSGSYNIDGTITIDYVQSFQNGAVVDVPRLQFDIPNLSNAPGPYLYLSKRPYSETRDGKLNEQDIHVPIDSGSDGQFNVKGRFDQFLDEIQNVQDLQDYSNGSWIVWCRPFGVWIGGGAISVS